MKRTIDMGLIAAAGQKPEELKRSAAYEELPLSSYDSATRTADQDRDGVLCRGDLPVGGHGAVQPLRR